MKIWHSLVGDFSATEVLRALPTLQGETYAVKHLSVAKISTVPAPAKCSCTCRETRSHSHYDRKEKSQSWLLSHGGINGARKHRVLFDMGLKEDELQPLVDAWVQSNPI